MNHAIRQAGVFGTIALSALFLSSFAAAQAARDTPGQGARDAADSAGKGGRAAAVDRSSQSRGPKRSGGAVKTGSRPPGSTTSKAIAPFNGRGGDPRTRGTKPAIDSAPRKPAANPGTHRPGGTRAAETPVIGSGDGAKPGDLLNGRGKAATRSESRGNTRRRGHRGSDAFSYPPRGTPKLSINSSEPLKHVLSFAGRRHRGHGNGLPNGVTGVEIWGKLGGPPPADPSELSRSTVTGVISHTVRFDASSRGGTAYYAVRYVNSRGTGDFSRIVSATIKP